MKKCILLAILSGILLSLAWPTYGFSLIIFGAFTPLLLAEHSIRKNHTNSNKKVLLTSYIAFLIWNTSTTWWLVYASVFGALFANLVNSLLMSGVFWAYHIIAKKNSLKNALIFLVCIWCVFEKMHLNWEFSWPWLNLGNAFSEDIHYIQWYEYTGSFGGTLWVWIVNILLFLSVIRYKKHKKVPLTPLYALLWVVIPIIISLFIFRNYKEKGSETQIIVLQPNIDPYQEKYQLTNLYVSNLLIRLSSDKISPEVSFILAPETVFAEDIPYSGINHSSSILTIKNYIKNYPNTSYIGGVSLVERIWDKNKITRESNFFEEKTNGKKVSDTIWFNDYNSAILIQNHKPWQLYHKSKLVVGVENFPYKTILPNFLKHLMIDLGGSVSSRSTQKDRTVFHSVSNQEKAAPIICYESVYGQFVSEYVRNGANFLSIITNDSWWGNTQGHKQLLSYARLRAIENRRSVARSANCGISAFINQKGEIISYLPYLTQGSLKQTIQLNNELTFYTQFGDYIFRIALFISVFITAQSLLKRKEIFYL